LSRAEEVTAMNDSAVVVFLASIIGIIIVITFLALVVRINGNLKALIWLVKLCMESRGIEIRQLGTYRGNDPVEAYVARKSHEPPAGWNP
jgi:hypothetical protein